MEMNRPTSASYKGRHAAKPTTTTLGDPSTPTGLAYAMSVQRALSARDAAQQPGRSSSSNDEDTSSSTHSVLDISAADVLDAPGSYRPTTAYSKPQLGTSAHQIQMDMRFDLHTNSSKPNPDPAATASINSIQGSETSVLVQGNAISDLSAATAGKKSAVFNELPSQQSISPGLGSEYKNFHEPSRRPNNHGLGSSDSDHHASESLWDNTELTEDEYSPVLDPPLSSTDLDGLFAYIGQYKPEQMDLESALKPFLPEYMPAIGDLEAMIKIPPPGAPSAASTKPQQDDDAVLQMLQDLGIILLDEPAAKQSDPAVLHYQLKSVGLSSANAADKDGLVHAIQADSAAKTLAEWIESTNSPQWASSRTLGPDMRGNFKFPAVDTLMQAWEPGFVDCASTLVAAGPAGGLIGSLDLPLDDCVRLACAILGIPLAKKSSRSLIDAVHCLFEVYTSFAQNQHFNNESCSVLGPLDSTSSQIDSMEIGVAHGISSEDPFF